MSLAVALALNAPVADVRAEDAGSTNASPPTAEPVRKKKRKKKGPGTPKEVRRRERTPALHQRIGQRWMFLAPVEARLAAGGADDWFLRDTSGGFVSVSASIEPAVRYSRGRFRLGLPLAVAHRETTGESLRQTDLAAGFVSSLRLGQAFELSLDGRVEQRWRPDWPDEFQPGVDAAGGPVGRGTTDRFGCTPGGGGLEAWWRPPTFALDLGMRAESLRAVQPADPAYDPVLGPTHLVPLDRDAWRLAWLGRGRLAEDLVRWRFELQARWTQFERVYARDARTGLTHADPGGLPANPKFAERRFSADTAWSVAWRAVATRFQARLGGDRNEDLFDGYSTWHQLRVGTGVVVRPWRDLVVTLDYDFRGRRYSGDGYAEGSEHPPLDGNDDTRSERAHVATAEVSYGFLGKSVVPFLGARLQAIDTNFPDYVPYVHPATAPYAVDWDRRGWLVESGVRFRY